MESPDSQLLCAESCFGAGNKAFPSHWIPNCPGRERALGAPPSTSLAQTVAGRLLETRAAGLHRLLELLLTEDSGLPSPAPFLELSGRLGDTPGGGGGWPPQSSLGRKKQVVWALVFHIASLGSIWVGPGWGTVALTRSVFCSVASEQVHSPPWGSFCFFVKGGACPTQSFSSVSGHLNH